MTDIFPITLFHHPEPGAPPLATWDDVALIYRPYEEIWEADSRWLMGRDTLHTIVDHWRHHLPTLTNRVHDEVTIEFQYPTVQGGVSIVHAIPSQLIGILQTRMSEVVKLRWPSWEPALHLFVGEPANALSMDRIANVIRSTESRAHVLGLPELWQIGAAAFGIPMSIGSL